MAAPSPDAALLRLPRELRDEIYSYFVESRQRPPTNPSAVKDRRGTHDIRFQTDLRSWRYPCLVWVNQQLRSEFISYLEGRLKSCRSEVGLDIMVKGYLFYPTWTCLPTMFTEQAPFDLHVNLRISSTESFRSNDARYGLARQPGSGFRSLLQLLRLFVAYGPSFGFRLACLGDRKLFAIDNLSVNVTFHDDYTPDTWPDTAHAIFRMLKALALDGPAEGVARTIHAHTDYLHAKESKCFNSGWTVSSKPEHEPGTLRRWREFGFLAANQDSLLPGLRRAAEVAAHEQGKQEEWCRFLVRTLNLK